MKALLKKIRGMFIVNWSMALQYRADLFLWLLTEAATPLISMAVWYTVAKHSLHGPTPQQTLNYYILTIIVIIATSSWIGFFVSREILDGSIAQRIIKPLSPFWGFIANNIAEKTLRLLIPLPIFVISLFLFPNFFVPSLYQLQPWLLFFISLGLAATLAFCLDMIFGLMAFWLEDAINLRWYKDTLQMITSGILIPVAVMPPSVQTIVNILPFRSIITTPIDILMGNVHGSSLAQSLAIQSMWAIITCTLTVVLWKRGLKRYAPPGQ